MSALSFTRREDQELHEALTFMADGIRQIKEGQASGFHYSSLYDFVLREGRFYVPEPHDFEQMEQRRCYDNALTVAALHGLPYIEGFAFSTVGIPVHHAWNADGDAALDVTWPVLGSAYIGVEFPPVDVLEARERGATMIDDWQRDWPLLRQPWKEAR